MSPPDFTLFVLSAGFRFTQAEREFLVSIYDRNGGSTPERITCEAIAKAFTASPVRNPQSRLVRPRRHTTGSIQAPKPWTPPRDNSTTTAPGGGDMSPLNALLRMRAQQEAAARTGRDVIVDVQQRRRPRHIPGVSLDDFAMLDSESPMFPSCMLDEGANADSEVKSAFDDEWEIDKVPEDDGTCSPVTDGPAECTLWVKPPAQPVATVPAFPTQLSDVFATVDRSMTDPATAMIQSLPGFRCWSGNLAGGGLNPGRADAPTEPMEPMETSRAPGSDREEPVCSDDDVEVTFSAEDDNLDVELYANLTRGSRTGRWIPLDNSECLGRDVCVEVDSETDVDMVASATAELGDGAKHPVQWKQIKTWFENRRMTQKRISEGRDRPPRRPKTKTKRRD